MSYRDDLAALEARVASLKSELAETEEMAAEARRLVRQHVIEAELATPCTALWSEMKGDERVRHCNHCNKNVYNFSELTRDEIDAVIVKTEGKLCGRLFLRADGTVLTKDCTRDVRVRPSRFAVALGAGALAIGLTTGAAAVASQFAGAPDKTLSQLEADRLDLEPTMGTMRVEDPPPPEEGLEAGYMGGFEADYQGGVSFTSQRPNN